MRLRFLGTAAAEGAPALFCTCKHCAYARKKLGKEVRGRAGSIIDDTLKIDFGPDSFAQMIANHLDYTSLKSVLITHSHEDHFSISDLRCRRKGMGQIPDDVPPLMIYGNARIGEMLAEKPCDRLAFHQLKCFETTDIEGYQVTPLEAVHCPNPKSNQYPIFHKGKTLYRDEEAFFYLIEKDGESILYAHDTAEFTDADMDFLAGRHIDLITLDCNNGCDDFPSTSHMSIKNVLHMREMLLANGAADAHTTFVANHFSHNGLVPYEELETLLPGFIVSYDSLEVSTAK